MKVIVNRPVEIDIKTIHVNARVRYPEDAMIQEGPEDAWREDDADQPKMPCMEYIEKHRVTSSWHWRPIIDIATGQILNWRAGVRASISYKVCDEFECEVKDSDNAIVASYNGYVLNFMAITDKGYGDYIYLEIDENGMIENWSFDEYDFKKLDEYYED